MDKFRNRLFLLPAFAFLIFYFLWLSRAYYDVAYEDEIQIIAGNMSHMLDHNYSVQDLYYRSPFLLFFSNFIVFLNCKLFAYNTYYENIISGLVLFCIAVYYIRSNIAFFEKRSRFYFSVLAALVVFCLSKWELSLWGGGFSHYIVVFFGFICTDIAHRYYLTQASARAVGKYALSLYVILSLIAIPETTSYFLPFQLAILILMLVNYRLFRSRINIIKWRIILGTTIGLIIVAFLINSSAEYYSSHHAYDGYGKVNMSGSIGSSFNKIVKDPLFVIKFYLISNAGSLIEKDYYPVSSVAREIMPWLGLVVLLFYGYSIYIFIKRKKIEGIFAISLMLYTVIFYGTVLVGRLVFNDVYYGAASRYSAATFSGILGIVTFSLFFINPKQEPAISKRFIYYFILALMIFCNGLVNINQWRMAKYRKESFLRMANFLRKGENLETLMGYTNEITEKARKVMIRNKLNVFKPEKKLETYTINSDLAGQDTAGFYKPETSSGVPFRWTNGKAILYLPNLYTIKDTIKVLLKCYVPNADTPRITLDDNLSPFRTCRAEGGYEYFFAFPEQKVLFKLSIENNSYVPHEINKDSPDTRLLGLMFKSVSLSE